MCESVSSDLRAGLHGVYTGCTRGVHGGVYTGSTRNRHPAYCRSISAYCEDYMRVFEESRELLRGLEVVVIRLLSYKNR